MGVPIVTSDLQFARGICGDAARYFAPGNPDAACDAIAEVALDHALAQRLMLAGRARLAALGMPADKQSRLLDLVYQFADRSRVGGKSWQPDGGAGARDVDAYP